MTPTARAKRIFPVDPMRPDIGSDLRAKVAAEINNAVEEAVANEFANGALDQQRRCAKHCEQARAEGFAEGFAACREMAAKVADEWYATESELYSVGKGRSISEAVCALQPPAKEEK